MSRRPRVLFVRNRSSSFIEIDRELLERRYDVHDLLVGRPVGRELAALRAVLRADAVVGWWAAWQTFWPVTFAWLMGKPSLVIVGGYDVANLPEIGYGNQRGGPRRWISRWVMHRARALATNSYYSQGEVGRNVGIPAESVAVMHHGIPDPYGELPEKPKTNLVLTVGVVDRVNLDRKGLRGFARAAAYRPESSFVIAGPVTHAAGEELRAEAPANLTITGWLEAEELHDLYRRATVYVQASQHEGFGMAVAEAMLAGCVPVVTSVGALPEVVGDLGVKLADPDPERLAEAIGEALALGPDAGARARQRVLSEFSIERRGQALWGLIDGLLGAPGPGPAPG